MSDNQDFLVIGVLGLQAAGKSTIMNALFGYDAESTDPPPFPTSTQEAVVRAQHTTTGVDLRVTPDSCILLDTQPVMSASVLSDLLRLDTLPSEAVSAENAQEIMALQVTVVKLAVFLLSTCHAVLFVSQGLEDKSLWRFMKTVEMLMLNVPDMSLIPRATSPTLSPAKQSALPPDRGKGVESGARHSSSGYCAETVFVHNGLLQHEMSALHFQLAQAALDAMFLDSPFQAPGKAVSSAPLLGLAADDSKGLSLFMLPNKSSGVNAVHHVASFQRALELLQDQVLTSERRSLLRPMSEKDWLQFAGRMWDTVTKLPGIAQYNRTVQQLGTYLK
eukprot:jgi/Chlat1/3843/Chrsp26S03976